MNAITLLKQQHDDVEKLFEKFEEAETAERRQLFVRIADNLSAHAIIEEKVFYPATYVGEMKELLHEAVEEHLSVKRLIADLLDLDAEDPSFEAKMKVLQEQVEHHVEEEEEKLFKQVRANLSAQELEALGAQMEQLFEELQKGSPSSEVPLQTAQAARLDE
jgi:hypothetical protein